MMSRLLRGLLLGACLLPLALALGCDSGGPAPPDLPATSTALAYDAATSVAHQQLAGTFVAGENATTTAGLGLFERTKPLLKVTLKDAGTVLLAGLQTTSVELTVTNADTAAHHIVIRLYDHNSLLSTTAYSIGALDVPAGGTASTKVTSSLPFAAIATQIQQIDKDADYRPPAP